MEIISLKITFQILLCDAYPRLFDCFCQCFCGNLFFGVSNDSCDIARQPVSKDSVTNLSRKYVSSLINLTYRLSSTVWVLVHATKQNYVRRT